ncbi:hypothetical protein LCGC14_1974180 [marine sediment metagenome]|uniref:Uncharacterized protein n=1 Tax=marine sediment metagenome TaxID=412755 RepID=A0A0F9FAT8_9ZZZZ
MDRYMRGQLDRHIMGLDIHDQDDAVLHKCPQCGVERKLAMFFELGGWFYTPESEAGAYCEKCDCELEIEEI